MLLETRDFGAIAKLVPQTTLAYLTDKYGEPGQGGRASGVKLCLGKLKALCVWLLHIKDKVRNFSRI
jgi:hypothetical protein